MMFGLGPLEVLIVLVVIGVILAGFMGRRSKDDASPRGRFSLGHAKLNCPHCHLETTAGKPLCEHCGHDL